MLTLLVQVPVARGEPPYAASFDGVPLAPQCAVDVEPRPRLDARRTAAGAASLVLAGGLGALSTYHLVVATEQRRDAIALPMGVTPAAYETAMSHSRSTARIGGISGGLSLVGLGVGIPLLLGGTGADRGAGSGGCYREVPGGVEFVPHRPRAAQVSVGLAGVGLEWPL